MSSFDWKTAVRGVAPALAGVLGGPAAGLGVKVLADALLGGSSGDDKADAERIGQVISGGITPEIHAKLVEADNALKIELAKLGVEIRRLEVEETKAYISDAQNAREVHKSNASVIQSAFWINALAYVVVCGVLAGSFAILLGHGADKVKNVDPGIAAMVGSIIGAAVQFIVQNAAQASGFLFGSSPSSRANAAKMADAVESAVKRGPAR